jgi:hypothetical protein
MKMARELDLSQARITVHRRRGAEQPECSRPVAITKPDARWGEAIVGTLALWFFVLLIYLPTILDRHAGDSWKSVVLDAGTLLVSAGLALTLFPLFQIVARWPTVSRLAVLAVAVTLVSTVQTTFDLLYTGWIAQNVEASWGVIPRDLSRAYRTIFNYACIYSVNLTLFQLMFTRRRELRGERQLAEARWAAQQAQLTALRFQLNPHFLFNTLNAISSMIVTGRNKDAEEMTDRLSSFLRASLSSDPTELVPLETELALIEEYLEIEAIRFGDRLAIDIPCTTKAGEVLVPSFLLQPLVENAIKYGVGPSPGPVTISVGAAIDETDLVLSVADDGMAAADAPKPAGTGVGLENVRRRLEAVYGGRASVDARPLVPGFGVTIRIPMDAAPLRFPAQA